MASIGQDLSRLRQYKKWTLQDLHKRTRIAVHLLESIENDRIFDSPTVNDVYARSYVRTAARALGIDEEAILSALDQQRAGTYEGGLLDPWPDIRKKTTTQELDAEGASDLPKTPQTSPSGGDAPTGATDRDTPAGEPAAVETPSTDAAKGDSVKTGEKDLHHTSDSGGAEPGTKSDKIPDTSSRATDPAGRVSGEKSPDRSAGERANRPDEPSVDWAAMGHRFTPTTRRSSGWLLGVAILLVALAGALWYVMQSDLLETLFDRDRSALEQPVEGEQGAAGETDGADTGSLGLNLGDELPAQPDASAQAAPGSTQLDSTLYLTVYGAYGALDPVRIWSDLKPRFDPYWIEQGEAMQFEFQDTIRIRNQLGNLLLHLNGHWIRDHQEAHYSQEQQGVEITRDMFTPEAQWASPRSFELPDTSVSLPDTIRMRPIFN